MPTFLSEMQKLFGRPQHYTIFKQILSSKTNQNYKKYEGPELDHSRKISAKYQGKPIPF